METAPGRTARDSFAWRIGIGLSVGVAAAALRLLLHPMLGADARYVLQAGAAVVATWIAGYGAGAAAAILALLTSFWIQHPGEIVFAWPERFGAFAFLASVLTLLVLQVGRWREAERRLREREADYRSLFEDSAHQAELVRRRVEELEGLMEVAPVAIWVSHDRECRVITGNRAANEFFDARPGENVSPRPGAGVQVAGRRFFRDGRELTARELPMQVAAAGGVEVRDAGIEALLPSGRRIHMWGHALPLRDAGGQVRGAIGAFLDMTERQRQEEELSAANRAKDEFLATLSHELRTPMNAILGWSHMIATGKLPPEHLTSATAAIVRNAEAQRQLVEDVLDLSRIIRGQFQVRIVPVNLATVIERAVESVQAAADAKSLRLCVVECPGLPPIPADPDRLQQVFWNLLSNAIKFTPAGGGEITIAVARQAGALEVSVADPGEGIAQEFLPRVFDRFSQADSSLTRAHGGLGLGLAITRHLVELHGGTVTARSEGPGTGSTFRVRLPLGAG